MPWKYYTGIQDTFAASIWNAPPDATHVDVKELQVGAVRGIFQNGEHHRMYNWARMLISHGIFPVVTIDTDNFAGIGSGTWTTVCQQFAERMVAAGVKMVEIGNEPAYIRNEWNEDGTGGFYNRLRDAIPIFRSRGIEVVAGSPPTGWETRWYLGMNNNQPSATPLFALLDGVSLHPYFGTPAGQLGHCQNMRNALDSYGAAAAGLDFWITEFGWGTNSIPSNQQARNLLCPGATEAEREDSQQGRLFQAYTNWEENCQALRLRAACWYWLRDYSGGPDGTFQYCGLRTDVGSPFNAAPWRWKGGGNQQGGGIKATLDSFGKGANVADPPPEVFTDPIDEGEIGKNWVRLKGRVDPNGFPTFYRFEYGKTTAYGSLTETKPAGQGTTQVTVKELVGGLDPDTLYHYRLRAGSTVSGGQVFGVDRTFRTLVPPLPPEVSTGAASGVTQSKATLWGSVDPNQLATTYYFEYGTSATGPWTSVPVPAASAGAGQTPVLKSVNVAGLTPGTTYHYRVRATNSLGSDIGEVKSFTTTQATTTPRAVPQSVAPPVLLPLDLTVEITTSDNQVFDWFGQPVEPWDCALEISCSNQQGDGFAEASCVVPRPIDLDWADMNLLDRVRFLGADESIAFEGRVVGLPRSIDPDGEWIEVQFQGYMHSGRDRTFCEVIVDRSGDRWEEPSLAFRKALIAADFALDVDYTVSVDSGSIHFKGVTDKQIRANSQAIVQYRPPAGLKVASFQYQGTQRNIGANEEDARLFATDDDTVIPGSWPESDVLTLDNTVRADALSVPRRFLALRLRASATHGSATEGSSWPDKPANFHYTKIAVYGDHDVPLRAVSGEPDAVYASDVIAYLANKYCPLLDPSDVQPTAEPIPHLVFDTPTTPAAAFEIANSYHRWTLAAWEEGKLQFEPPDLGKADWVVRKGDPGVQLRLQGHSADTFRNGIVVLFTDVDERQRVLWPDDYPQLRDDDPDNPANKQGYRYWGEPFEISTPVTGAAALALGSAALRDSNAPKAPGEIEDTLGYIEDAFGNLQPGWKVRSGQTIAVMGLPNDRPRLITAVKWSGEGYLQITVEQPSGNVDAVLARLENASQARGL